MTISFEKSSTNIYVWKSSMCRIRSTLKTRILRIKVNLAWTYLFFEKCGASICSTFKIYNLFFYFTTTKIFLITITNLKRNFLSSNYFKFKHALVFRMFLMQKYKMCQLNCFNYFFKNSQTAILNYIFETGNVTLQLIRGDYSTAISIARMCSPYQHLNI